MSRIGDGLGTTLTGITSNMTVYKTRITPFAIEGGDKIDRTTLENSAWRTGTPKSLKSVENCSFEGEYDPSVLIGSPVNVNQQWRILYSGGDGHVFWGFLKRMEPGELVEGSRAMITGALEITNRDSAGNEVPPVYYSSTETMTGTATG